MLKRQYMVPCKPLAAPDSKPLINANIKWQVPVKTANNEACSYYAREKVCETDLDQTYKGLQGEGVVDPGSVK